MIELKDQTYRLARTLSGGQQKMVALAMTSHVKGIADRIYKIKRGEIVEEISG
ncbi:MAG: hypothetical protein QXN34_03630 [Archaeoglobaceae archaeon]